MGARWRRDNAERWRRSGAHSPGGDNRASERTAAVPKVRVAALRPQGLPECKPRNSNTHQLGLRRHFEGVGGFCAALALKARRSLAKYPFVEAMTLDQRLNAEQVFGLFFS